MALRRYKRDAKGRFARTGGGKSKSQGSRRVQRKYDKASYYRDTVRYQKSLEREYVRQTGDRPSGRQRRKIDKRNNKALAKAASIERSIQGQKLLLGDNRAKASTRHGIRLYKRSQRAAALGSIVASGITLAAAKPTRRR